MFTKKVVRTLGVVVGVSSLLIACQPDEGASVQTKGGLDTQCDPLLDKGCAPTTAPTSVDPKAASTPSYTISWCDPISVEVINNGGTQKFYGNTRVTEVLGGKAACFDTERGSLVESGCPFTKELADQFKLPYIFGKGGHNGATLFTIAGNEALGPDGKPGPYVYGQQVTKTTTVDRLTGATTTRYSVPCLPPQGADMAATPAGTELGGGCVVETINATTNVALHQHSNYCKLEVCGKTGSNTDATTPGTAKTAYVMCWKGQGAALNDPNGTERDPVGIYYAGVEACHRAWQPSGASFYEVTAAKRPSTSGYPPKVIETTVIRWLPLAPGVSIGNP
jgi:hypothetical protein